MTQLQSQHVKELVCSIHKQQKERECVISQQTQALDKNDNG